MINMYFNSQAERHAFERNNFLDGDHRGIRVYENGVRQHYMNGVSQQDFHWASDYIRGGPQESSKNHRLAVTIIEQALTGVPPRRACFRCRSTNHMIRHCPEPPLYRRPDPSSYRWQPRPEQPRRGYEDRPRFEANTSAVRARVDNLRARSDQVRDRALAGRRMAYEANGAVADLNRGLVAERRRRAWNRSQAACRDLRQREHEGLQIRHSDAPEHAGNFAGPVVKPEDDTIMDFNEFIL